MVEEVRNTYGESVEEAEAGDAVAERVDHAGVDLDGDDAAREGEEAHGEVAGAGADLEHGVPGSDPGAARHGVERARAREQVLPPRPVEREGALPPLPLRRVRGGGGGGAALDEGLGEGFGFWFCSGGEEEDVVNSLHRGAASLRDHDDDDRAPR